MQHFAFPIVDHERFERTLLGSDGALWKGEMSSQISFGMRKAVMSSPDEQNRGMNRGIGVHPFWRGPPPPYYQDRFCLVPEVNSSCSRFSSSFHFLSPQATHAACVGLKHHVFPRFGEAPRLELEFAYTKRVEARFLFRSAPSDHVDPI